jgi:pimeloyl-ACP methyl ester carboxylesterase
VGVTRPEDASPAAVQVVLVHGANHDGWCWTPVLERLERSGVSAWAPDLPLTSYADDVAAVRRELAVRSRLGPVVLVAHSYAGLLISEAGHDAAELVFVAARMPISGEVPAETTESWSFPAFRESWILREDGAVTLGVAAVPILYGRSPRNLVRVAQEHWRPMWSRVPSERASAPAWRTVPSTYVVCLADETVRLDAQRACAARAAAVFELVSDHSPFFSAPDQLSAVLVERARLHSGRSA